MLMLFMIPCFIIDYSIGIMEMQEKDGSSANHFRFLSFPRLSST